MITALVAVLLVARMATVSISTESGMVFQPPKVVVERGDFVRWHHPGASVTHTTTHGLVDYVSTQCSHPLGLWDADLPPGGEFVRRFDDAPGLYTYCCKPHPNVTEAMVFVVRPTELAVSGDGPICDAFLVAGGAAGQQLVSFDNCSFGLD